MKLVHGLRALALTALIFSPGCASDGTDETLEAVEEDNQVPSQSDDEAVDAELPTAEAASVEAEQGMETIDQNSEPGVEALATEQQIAVDEAAQAGAANGAGQELIAAPIPGAETEAYPGIDAPAESPAMPEAPIAQAEAPMASPEVAPEESPAIPTIADVVNDSTSAQADAAPQKEVAPKKAKKGKKSKRAQKAPTLSGNEKMYIVQPGDTLAQISKTLFGSSREWRNLAEMNGLDGKGLIFPGDAIKYVPNEKTAAFEARYDGLPKATVAVEKGDTLSKIASKVMGDASYWKMLWRWNEAAINDPNQIAVGMNLEYVTTKDLEGVSTAAAH